MNCGFLIEAGFAHFNSIYIEIEKLALEYDQLSSVMVKKRLIDSINLHIELTRYFLRSWSNRSQVNVAQFLSIVD